MYGLVHSEYQGWNHAPGGYCIRSGEPFSDKQKCWQNALTLATSTNGGSTFSHTTPPSHLVAGSPTRWARGNGPIGFFQPSHIVKGQDGWHYMIARVMGGSQPLGSCVLRTRNVADPTSWRGWSGTGFTVTFPSPYLNTLDPAEHICQPATNIGTLSESLGWSTYFKKWLFVGSADNADGVSGPGFYFLTSDDLINWSPGEAADEGGAALDVAMLRRAVLSRSVAARSPEQDPQLRHDGPAALSVLHPFQHQLMQLVPRPRPDPDPDRVLQPGSGRAGRRAGGLDRVGPHGRAGDLRRIGLAGR